MKSKTKSTEYNHLKIEKKWQKYWEKNKTFVVKEDPKKKKFYGLVEFPYPSGDGIHMGHVRTDTAMDVICRKKRMEGLNVLYPMGWDAFGLPTENYAIKTGIHPTVVTKKNIITFKRQLKSLGLSFDWSREINTTDPKYYKWTQWIFLKFFEKGLAYKKKMLINWCPKDKTGLANEEVVDGCCERCGAKVEKKEKEQWMLAITKYADRLDKDLDDVNFLEKIKIQQRNWIGKSEGAEIEFKVKLPDTSNEYRSFLMGVGDITNDLKNIGVKVEKKYEDGDYEITIPKQSISNFEKLISNKLKPGFWNEYVNRDEAVFIFKDESEKVSRFVWDESNENVLLSLCSKYAKYDFKNIRSMLEENSWYAGYINNDLKIKVFTTRPDTLFGVTYLVVAPENELVQQLKSQIKNWQEVENYIKEVKSRPEIERTAEGKDKTGIELKGIYVVNPVNNVEVPVYIADYVLAQYGTGSVMAVPAHDDRDFAFAKKYNLPIKEVISGGNVNEKAYVEDGVMINSSKFNGRKNDEIMKEITEFAGGKITITYKLRDWIFSRQHYWGEPIPVVHCEKCGIVALPEKDLPLKLPMIKKYQPTDNGESPLASIPEWVNTKCPKCGGKAKRETDTMPNWAGSSWYYLRYVDPNNKTQFASAKNLKYWTPVDWYNGGMEHTTLHLLYSRFWHKFLYDLKLVPTNEPYYKRTSQGFVLGEDGEKMSKSRGNVINPDGIVKTLGADSLRIYEMFMGPFDQAIAWSSNNIVGSRRFLEKVWKLQEKVAVKYEDSEEIILLLNKTIKKVGEDIENIGFNTAISGMMILTNSLENKEKISKETYLNLIKILSPFAPHMCEEIWQNFGGKKSITLDNWPKYDDSKLISSLAKIVIQINGKIRTTIDVPTDSLQETVEAEALKNEDIVKWIDGKKIIKKIFIKNRIMNFVV